MKLLNLIKKAQVKPVTNVITERELMRREAQIGGQLFGAVPAGHRREFFCMDDHTWIWYEQWTDEMGVKQEITTKYEIRNHGVLKTQENQAYRYADEQEKQRLFSAIQLYYSYVMAYVYGKDVSAQIG